MSIKHLLSPFFVILFLSFGQAAANQPQVMFDNSLDAPLESVPLKPTQFRITEKTRITSIQTYHWNKGQGAIPGSIALEGRGKKMFGPWKATGKENKDGLANAFWEVTPNISLEPGLYTVLDSNPETWSRNSRKDNEGIVRIFSVTDTETLTAKQGDHAVSDQKETITPQREVASSLDRAGITQTERASDIQERIGQETSVMGDTGTETLSAAPTTIAPPLMDEAQNRAAFQRLDPLPPLSSMLSSARASSVAPRLDPGEFSRLQYLGAVSAVKRAMEELLGPMSGEARDKFEAQWAAIYDFPADAAITYLNAAAPILGEVLSLRASMMKVMQGYDNFINQAQMARYVGNLEASHELMRRAGQSAALLKAIERKMNQSVETFAALGDLPDVNAIKQAAAQNYAGAKNLLKDLVNPPQLSGEYEPAAYQTIQNPLDGGRIANPDPTIIRTEKDDSYDVTTYFMPLKSLGENRVVMYSCETDKEGDKSSFLQLFEKTDDGSFVTYGGGNGLSKIVLKLTEDGYQKFEYWIGPKDHSEDNNDFSERVVELLSQNKLPEMELAYDLRSRTFHATYVQYQSTPTDDEFDWNTWESNLKKYQKEFLAEFEGERLAFETLAQRIALPEPIPAENIFWILEKIERINDSPTITGRVSPAVLNEAMDRIYREMMSEKVEYERFPMLAYSQHTDVSDTGIDNIDERSVFDDADSKKTAWDSLTIKNRLTWNLPTPVIAQAGGTLNFTIQAEREVSKPLKAVLVPSPFPHLITSLTPSAVEADGTYKGYIGKGVQTNLLDQHQNAGPGKVVQTSQIALPLDEFYSDYAEITLSNYSDMYSSLRSLNSAGVKLHFKRKIMTPEEAAALSSQMGEDLELLATKDRKERDTKQQNREIAQQKAKESLADFNETKAFHETNIRYEALRAEKYNEELNRELAEARKNGGQPSEDQQRRIAALRFSIISAQSNAISEQDRIRELQTGKFERSETPFDTMARVQFRQNIEKNIRKIEGLETQSELAEKYIEFLPEGDRAQAKKTLQKIRDESPDDLEKYQKLNAALKQKWQGATEAKIAAIDEDLAWKDAQVQALENIKTGAEAGMLYCSMMGGPQAIALTYQFATGWAEKDLLTGIKQSVSMYSDAVDIAWSTYDGYCQDGWSGAAKAGTLSLAMNKGLPFLLGKMGKNADLPASSIGKTGGDSIADATKNLDNVKPALVSGKPGIDDVKLYKAELENAEKQVKGFVSDYHAWKKGVKDGLPDEEIKRLHRKVIDSTAAINQNPTAKGYLKYNAPPATGRFFDKSLDNIHTQARNQYYKTMKEAGYSDHEIFAIRNAASSGSTGMDFDQALKEQPDFIPFKNKDGSVSLKRNLWLTKNGKPVSRHDWQQDAQKAWNDAYKNSTNGYSAPHSWEKMTSRVDPEAYRQMAILNINKDLSNVGEIMDSLDPKWVRQMSDVTLFKAGEMLKDKSLSRLAGVREACRGTAKDLDGKFLPFISTRLSELKKISPAKLTPSDKHNIKRLESALSTFTRVKEGFDAIGKADIPPTQWDDTIKKSTGGKGIIQTIQDLSDLTQSLFM